MPVSFVINLEALNNGRIDGFTGKAVQGFLLNHWRSVFPEIGSFIHGEDNDPNSRRPYSISPLMGLPQKGYSHTVRKGQRAWFRVAVFDGLSEFGGLLLEDLFYRQWIESLPAIVEIPHRTITWKILNAHPTSKQRKWENMQNFQFLYDSHLEKDSIRSLRWIIEFMTPATFHIQSDIFLPLPVPHKLFWSWLEAWERNSPYIIPKWEGDLDTMVRVNRHEIKTIPIKYRSHKFIGFVGMIILSPLPGLRLETARHLDNLVRYAYYCGTGFHTTQGMGLTLPSSIHS